MSDNEYKEMLIYIIQYFPDIYESGFDAMYEIWKYQKDIRIIAENHIGITFIQ